MKISEINTIIPGVFYKAFTSGLRAEECWKHGYDIIYTNESEYLFLTCNTATSRKTVNAVDFLFTEKVPFGNYLKNCTGILKTKEYGREYLYATCNYESGKLSQRLDITDCKPGMLELDKTTGLIFCDSKITLASGSSSGGYHRVSRYLPIGSYLLTCKDIKFFPCLGEGRLEASCAHIDIELEYIDSFLEITNHNCQIGDIVNVNGFLACDQNHANVKPFEKEHELNCIVRDEL